MVHPYDFGRQRKPESYPSLFCGKEKVKNTVAMSRLNTFAFVFDFNRYVAVCRFCEKSNRPV